MEPYLPAIKGPGATNGNTGVGLPEPSLLSDPPEEGRGEQGFFSLLDLLVRSGPPLPETLSSAGLSPEEAPIPPSLLKQELSPLSLVEILSPERMHDGTQEGGEESEEGANRPSEPEQPQEGHDRAGRSAAIPWTYPVAFILPVSSDRPSSEVGLPSSVDPAGRLTGPASVLLSTPAGMNTLETVEGAEGGSGTETILIDDTPGLDEEVRSSQVDTGPEKGKELSENLQSMLDLELPAEGEEDGRMLREGLPKDGPALAPGDVARERGRSFAVENGHGEAELATPENKNGLQKGSGIFTVNPPPPKEDPAFVLGQDPEAALPQEGRKVLEGRLAQLKEALGEQGLGLDSFSVTVAAKGHSRRETILIDDTPGLDEEVRSGQVDTGPEKGKELSENLQFMRGLDMPAAGEEGSRTDRGSLMKDGPALAPGSVARERGRSFATENGHGKAELATPENENGFRKGSDIFMINPPPPQEGPAFAPGQDAEAAPPQEGRKSQEAGNEGTAVSAEGFRPVLDAMKELLQLLKGGALPLKDPGKAPVDPGPLHLDRGDAGLPRREASPVGDLGGKEPSLGGDDWQRAGVLEKGGVYFKPEENRVWLSLEPELLGGIRGELELEHDRIKLHFIADSPMAKEVLEGSLDQLKEALGNQGLRLDSFSVTVASNGQHHLGDGLASFRHPGGNGERWQQEAGQQEARERPGTAKDPMDRLDRSRVDLFV